MKHRSVYRTELTPLAFLDRSADVFADKIARRPELIGVGGALHPSSGLKELPGYMTTGHTPCSWHNPLVI
jgi:hypothetical protein